MSDLTQVELFWLKKRIENWIRFGRIAQETILDRNRRVVWFGPGSIFAFVRWASNDYGTAISRIDVLRAVRPANVTRLFLMCVRVQKSCCASPAGPRSRESSKQSIP
jgi:Protein of unknown function (DUF2840)